MNNDIGILLDNLAPSQEAYLTLKQVNSLHEKFNFSLFTREIKPFLTQPKCAVTSVDVAFNFHGTLIATNLECARFLCNMYNLSRKFLYLFELEWFNYSSYNPRNYADNLSIYRNPNLTIVTPSEEYQHLFKSYASRDSIVIPNFNIEKIWSIR